jgi:hypothetical protein
MFRKVWLALFTASRSGARPQPENSTSADLELAPNTPTGVGLREVTGIYQDGKGTYGPGESVEFFQSDLRITPLCSADRSLNILLPAAALARLAGRMENCRGRGGLLKIPALLSAPTGVLGEPSLPPDYPKGASVFYYFHVDTDGDGKFSASDDAYHLIWQSGIHLSRTEHSDRTVYELTTLLTSSDAELIREADAGGVSEGIYPVPLRLTATRVK